MKRNFVSAALALTLALPLAGSVAFAQTTDPATQNQVQTNHANGKHNPHKMAMKLGRKLNLTPDQTAKLEPILAEREQKMQALKADTTLTPDQMRQQKHAISKNTHDELAGVLTADQLQQMKAMHKAHEAKQNGAAPTGM